MSTRKIASCVNVRVNLGNYQHVELTQYSEEEIDYVNDAERIAKEDALSKDLADAIVRSLRALPDRVSKGAVEVAAFEELVKAGIPQWLVNNPIPNIANKAKKLEVVAKSDAKQNLDKVTSIVADVEKNTQVAPKTIDSIKQAEKVEKVNTDVLSTSEIKNKEVDLFEKTIDAGSTTIAPVASVGAKDSVQKTDDFDEMFA